MISLITTQRWRPQPLHYGWPQIVSLTFPQSKEAQASKEHGCKTAPERGREPHEPLHGVTRSRGSTLPAVGWRRPMTSAVKGPTTNAPKWNDTHVHKVTRTYSMARFCQQFNIVVAVGTPFAVSVSGVHWARSQQHRRQPVARG